MQFKKVVGLAAAATMMLAMSATAFAAVPEDAEAATAKFYAYYDADGDGDSEWALAPHGMDDGNIVAAGIKDGVAYLDLGIGDFQMGSMTMSGFISALSGTGNAITVAKNSSEYADMITDAEISLDAAETFNALIDTDGDGDLTDETEATLSGVPGSMSSSVIMGGMVIPQHGAMDVMIVIE